MEKYLVQINRNKDRKIAALAQEAENHLDFLENSLFLKISKYIFFFPYQQIRSNHCIFIFILLKTVTFYL